MLVTVFTPTYNRAKLLARLYESLCRQTCTDFEWLIVDDGSSDDTHCIVKGFMQDGNHPFSIRYIYKENGGKHTAINTGVKQAEGELLFIADSDDKLPDSAIETIKDVYSGIENDNGFAGVCGLDMDFNGNVIGNGLYTKLIDASSLEIRNKFGVTGDMKEVFRTAVLKEFPFPEIQGERFCPEALVWNRIATKYKLRFFNKAIYSVEYQQGGLTSNIVQIRMKSPVASMMTYAEMTQYKEIPIKQKIRSAINYWRFRFCKKADGTVPHISAIWSWTKPIGYLMHLRDCRNLQK